MLAEAFIRKQPRQVRSQARLERLLAGASELLAEVGADRLTITLLAERAALTTGSVYEYVGDARDLIAAVAASGLDRLHATLREGLEPPQSAAEARQLLRRALAVSFEVLRTEPGLAEALAFVDSDPALAHINLDDSRRNGVLLAELVRPFVDHDHRDGLVDTCVLLAHLSGSVAALGRLVGPDEFHRYTAAFESLLLDRLVAP